LKSLRNIFWGSTEAVFPETLSSVQLLKADNDVVICVGRENLKTVALVKKGKSISKIDLFSFSIYDATVVDDGIVFVGTISQENLNLNGFSMCLELFRLQQVITMWF